MLAADRIAIPASTGGAVSFTIDVGSFDRLRDYVVLASVSGTNPGTALPGGEAILAINWDELTTFMLRLVDTPAFDRFAGTLDAFGRAAARFDTLGRLPPESVGLTLSFACALREPWQLASNPINVTITP